MVKTGHLGPGVALLAERGFKGALATKEPHFRVIDLDALHLNAAWDQFDLDRGIWTKPSADMKQKKDDRVPLSAAALQLLREMRLLDHGPGHLFPGDAPGRPLQDIKRIWAGDAVGLISLTVGYTTSGTPMPRFLPVPVSRCRSSEPCSDTLNPT